MGMFFSVFIFGSLVLWVECCVLLSWYLVGVLVLIVSKVM